MRTVDKRKKVKIGGDEGDRTPDLCNAIAALSQLSYVPNLKCRMRRQSMNLAKRSRSVKVVAQDSRFRCFRHGFAGGANLKFER